MSRRSRTELVRRQLATRHDRPAAPGSVRLTVVLPAFGEAERIGSTVERVRRELGPLVGAGELEVVVVDDGSTDGTAAAARAAGADRVLAQTTNRGKGAAVRAGVLVAKGRTVAFTDADLAYAPAQLANLLGEVEDGWDVVVGSRHHDETTTVVRARWLREAGGRAINACTRLVLRGHHRDTQCGLKAFRSDVARVLFTHSHVDGFAFDVELYLLAERYGFSLTEVPVEVENSERSTVHVARDALRMLVDLARIRRLAGRGAYDLRPGELRALVEAAGAPSPDEAGDLGH